MTVTHLRSSNSMASRAPSTRLAPIVPAPGFEVTRSDHIDGLVGTYVPGGHLRIGGISRRAYSWCEFQKALAFRSLRGWEFWAGAERDTDNKVTNPGEQVARDGNAGSDVRLATYCRRIEQCKGPWSNMVAGDGYDDECVIEFAPIVEAASEDQQPPPKKPRNWRSRPHFITLKETHGWRWGDDEENLEKTITSLKVCACPPCPSPSFPKPLSLCPNYVLSCVQYCELSDAHKRILADKKLGGINPDQRVRAIVTIIITHVCQHVNCDVCVLM